MDMMDGLVFSNSRSQVTEVVIQDGVVESVAVVKGLSPELVPPKLSPSPINVRIIDSINAQSQETPDKSVEEEEEEEVEYDSYPSPEENFVYESPYATVSQVRRSQTRQGNRPPRKPYSGYFFFAQERRDGLRQEHPRWPMKKITTLMAEMWAKTSDTDKKAYLERAEEDSKRYRTEMEDYKKTDEYLQHRKFAKRRRKMIKARRKSLGYALGKRPLGAKKLFHSENPDLEWSNASKDMKAKYYQKWT